MPASPKPPFVNERLLVWCLNCDPRARNALTFDEAMAHLTAVHKLTPPLDLTGHAVATEKTPALYWMKGHWIAQDSQNIHLVNLRFLQAAQTLKAPPSTNSAPPP